MTIRNYKLKSIGACIIAIMAFDNDGLCQSCRVIDIDNVETTILPGEKSEDEKSEDDNSTSSYKKIPPFNDILTIVGKQKTSYEVEYIPSYEEPEIYQGRVFINLDKKKSVYDLETLNNITSVNKVYYPECIVTSYYEEIYTKHGYYDGMCDYMVSIDAATGDTLWKKQVEGTPHIRSANHISMIGDSIIDNKCGKALYKISPSNGIVEIKEDNGYLYLRRGVNKQVELIAIDMQKGEAVWKVRGDFSDFYFDESRIYTTNMCAIDKKTSKLLWNTDVHGIFGIVGNYIIVYYYWCEDDPEMLLLSKNTGEIVGHAWYDKEFCKSCFGDDYESCTPEFIFAEQGEGNKTAAIIKCNDGVYLYVFEAK
ncbi:MAG: PQQ-binding-like beta-propeller repeat protein [Salinivirgaceae bacterium]|nr:PQQ-binding-like beta-propeller repeat protein [Salinivirgaceae bacterium]